MSSLNLWIQRNRLVDQQLQRDPVLQRSTIFRRGLVYYSSRNLDKLSISRVYLPFLQIVRYCIFVQRRRDRINEKMKALQELIPRCNKVVYDIFYKFCFLSPTIERPHLF